MNSRMAWPGLRQIARLARRIGVWARVRRAPAARHRGAAGIQGSRPPRRAASGRLPRAGPRRDEVVAARASSPAARPGAPPAGSSGWARIDQPRRASSSIPRGVGGDRTGPSPEADRAVRAGFSRRHDERRMDDPGGSGRQGHLAVERPAAADDVIAGDRPQRCVTDGVKADESQDRVQPSRPGPPPRTKRVVV